MARERANRTEGALERAPVVAGRIAGEPARGVNVWERGSWPNPTASRGIFCNLFKVLRAYVSLCVDLGSGEVKTHALPDGTSFTCRVERSGSTQIITSRRRRGKPGACHLFVYDPASNT